MHARNAGLQRLRSITKRVGIATTVLTGVFAGLAAAGNSGHHHKRAAVSGSSTAPPTTTSTTVPAPPGLPPLGSGDEGQSAPQPTPPPAPPSAPPVQTQQPPVVTSGGS
jgi:hypothetical protein